MSHRRPPRSLRLLFALALALALGAALLLAGCGKPNRPNIELRKKNQNLEGQIAQLKQRIDVDRATIAGLQGKIGTVPTLEQSRLDRLFTVNAIRVDRLTGAADLDTSKPGHEGFKVYVELLDQTGDEFKASGSFVVEAFDLAAGPGGMKLGRWEFPVEQAQANWYSFFTRYEYVLTCAWQDVVPRHPDVTVKVTFTDELTGRQFEHQQVIKVDPPPAAPTTKPATQAATQAATQSAADSR
jgi:hypothetical protein